MSPYYKKAKHRMCCMSCDWKYTSTGLLQSMDKVAVLSSLQALSYSAELQSITQHYSAELQYLTQQAV